MSRFRAERHPGLHRQAPAVRGRHRLRRQGHPVDAAVTATARRWTSSTCWCARACAPSAERRFFDKVATSEPFQPLRDTYGDEGALEFIRRKCEVLDGDITDPLHGPHRGAGGRAHGQGARHHQLRGPGVLQPVAGGGPQRQHPRREVHRGAVRSSWDVPLVHMSTAFVAGNRSGPRLRGRGGRRLLPQAGRAGRARLRLEQELADAEKIVARLREQADDKALASHLPQEGAGAAGARRAATPTTRRRCGWPWAASASCGSPASWCDAGMERAAALGLAQHVHVHQVAWASR